MEITITTFGIRPICQYNLIYQRDHRKEENCCPRRRRTERIQYFTHLDCMSLPRSQPYSPVPTAIVSVLTSRPQFHYYPILVVISPKTNFVQNLLWYLISSYWSLNVPHKLRLGSSWEAGKTTDIWVLYISALLLTVLWANDRALRPRLPLVGQSQYVWGNGDHHITIKCFKHDEETVHQTTRRDATPSSTRKKEIGTGTHEYHVDKRHLVSLPCNNICSAGEPGMNPVGTTLAQSLCGSQIGAAARPTLDWRRGDCSQTQVFEHR